MQHACCRAGAERTAWRAVWTGSSFTAEDSHLLTLASETGATFLQFQHLRTYTIHETLPGRWTAPCSDCVQLHIEAPSRGTSSFRLRWPRCARQSAANCGRRCGRHSPARKPATARHSTAIDSPAPSRCSRRSVWFSLGPLAHRIPSSGRWRSGFGAHWLPESETSITTIDIFSFSSIDRPSCSLC